MSEHELRGGETTGFHIANGDQLVEIEAVQVKGFDVIEIAQFLTFINSNRQISREIFQLTGISDKNLQDAPTVLTAINAFF